MFNGFWNELKFSLSDSRNVLINIYTELELHRTKYNDLIYNTARIRQDSTSIITRLDILSTRLGAENSTAGINAQIRALRTPLDNILPRLDILSTRLGAENSTAGINAQIRGLRTPLDNILPRLDILSTRLGAENSTAGINAQIRGLRTPLDNILPRLDILSTRLGAENVSSGINYQIRQLIWVVQNLQFSSITINEAGDNFWSVLRQMIASLGSIVETSLSEIGQTARAILTFLESLIDMIVDLFVPSDMKFVTESFDEVKDDASNKIKPVTDMTDRFMDALNVNKQSERLARSGNGGLFGQSLENSLKFTLLGTEVNFTPIDDVFDGIKKIRMALSIFIIGTTGFALKRRIKGKEGLAE